jgi:adenosylhomocysteine nucleosidase
MADPKGATRVGMLAPMQPELQPIVRGLGLTGGDGLYRGLSPEGVEVVAMLTLIGMDNAQRAARRMLEHRVDHVMVVGIAGGVDPDLLHIGDVVTPEVVVRRATGRATHPMVLGGAAATGTLSCGDDLVTDPATLAQMGAAGVIAVDMETAAIGEVCEDAGVAWSAYRSISDFAGEGLIDEALLTMMTPDGTSEPDSVGRFLDQYPERKQALERLAHDMEAATEAAAAAAIAALTAL